MLFRSAAKRIDAEILQPYLDGYFRQNTLAKVEVTATATTTSEDEYADAEAKAQEEKPVDVPF